MIFVKSVTSLSQLNNSLSVAAGAKEVATGVGFAGYTTFDEVTKDVCSNTNIPVGTEGRLTDTRDGKTYWIAKQKDGLCWMTQNLDYTGFGGRGVDFTDNTTSSIQYFDPGEYVYVNPTIPNQCKWGDTYYGYPSTKNGFAACIGYGWADVSGLKDNNNPTAVIDYSHGEYDAHYLVGTYYNWKNAIKGVTVENYSEQEASDSICPGDWKLPLSGSNSKNKAGSFYYLLSELSYPVITEPPYYFLTGGKVGYPLAGDFTSSIFDVGVGGYYWSANSYSNSMNYSYALRFSATEFDTLTSNNYRSAGYSVRCVAR